MTNLTKPTPRPIDSRTDLQRAADAVAAAYTFPTAAWSREAVAIRRLLDVVRALVPSACGHRSRWIRASRPRRAKGGDVSDDLSDDELESMAMHAKQTTVSYAYRNDVSRLVDEVRRLRAKIARLEFAHGSGPSTGDAERKAGPT